MRTLLASAAILALGATNALAAEPVGDWLVKDGYAIIRIDNCNGKMWGIVVWEKTPGGTDKENPDAAKKARPTLGMPILLGLPPNPKEKGTWSGTIYNSQNGSMYDANISLANENALDLQGCLKWPLCLTQQWTRVASLPAGAPPLPPLKNASPAPTKQGAAKKGAVAAPGPSDTCLRVADEAAEQEKKAAKK